MFGPAESNVLGLLLLCSLLKCCTACFEAVGSFAPELKLYQSEGVVVLAPWLLWPWSFWNATLSGEILPVLKQNASLPLYRSEANHSLWLNSPYQNQFSGVWGDANTAEYNHSLCCDLKSTVGHQWCVKVAVLQSCESRGRGEEMV